MKSLGVVSKKLQAVNNNIVLPQNIFLIVFIFKFGFYRLKTNI